MLVGDYGSNWQRVVLSSLKFYRNSGPPNNITYAIVAPALTKILGLSEFYRNEPKIKNKVILLILKI